MSNGSPTVDLNLDADRLALVPMLDGVEVPGRTTLSRRPSTDGSMCAEWPDGTEVDAVGVAADMDGPVLLVMPLHRLVRYPETVSVTMPTGGKVRTFTVGLR